MSKYQFDFYNVAGNQISSINEVLQLNLVRAVNGVGALEILLPDWNYADSFTKENRISITRSLASEPGKLLGKTYWVITDTSKIRKNKTRYSRIQAEDLNTLLKRRQIPYGPGTSQAAKNTYADDMAKAIMRENYGTGTSARDISSVLTISNDASKAPILSKAFDYKDVLGTLQEIAKSSYQSGTYLAFDITGNNPNGFTFETYIGQRGVDRRYPVANVPIVIDADYNLGDLELIDKYSDSANTIYARGRGDIVAEVNDISRVISNIARIERFINAGQATTVEQATAEALMAMRNYRPRKILAAEFLQSENMQFGKEIDFGDFVTVQMDNKYFDVRLDIFQIMLNAYGEETINITLRSDT